jgi:glycosyltransferase involved in cell wall biosynthesis
LLGAPNDGFGGGDCMSAPSPDLSLVLACYNEELVIEDSVAQVIEVLDNTRYSYQIIFVDDCSKDRTRELIDTVIDRYPDHRMARIFHEHNKGRGGTVSDGIRAAEGEVVGFIDIDLEVHARYMPSCVQAVIEGLQVELALVG